MLLILFRLLLIFCFLSLVLGVGWYYWVDLKFILANHGIELGGIGSVASIIALTLPLFLWVLRPKKKVIESKYVRYNQKPQLQVESGRKYLDSLLLDNNLTTLTPIEQLAEAQAQYDRALDKGDANEAKKAMQYLLELARNGYGSSKKYSDVLSYCRITYKTLLDNIESKP